MLIDTHCHLDAAEFDADRDAVHAAALAAGVGRIVVPAVAVDGIFKTKTVVDRYPGFVAAYGIHPLYVQGACLEDIDVLRDWLVREQPVAIGEIGLDFYVPDNDPARQEFFFVEQLKLAREFDLPVLLHVRRAVDAVLKQLCAASACAAASPMPSAAAASRPTNSSGSASNSASAAP